MGRTREEGDQLEFDTGNVRLGYHCLRGNARREEIYCRERQYKSVQEGIFISPREGSRRRYRSPTSTLERACHSKKVCPSKNPKMHYLTTLKGPYGRQT